MSQGAHLGINANFYTICNVNDFLLEVVKKLKYNKFSNYLFIVMKKGFLLLRVNCKMAL